MCNFITDYYTKITPKLHIDLDKKISIFDYLAHLNTL